MTNDIYEFLKDSKGVIHVGASTGQERDVYASYGLPVVWIEAIPQVYEELVNNLKSDDKYSKQVALNYLITDKNEPNLVQFNIANNSYSSSVLPIKQHSEIWPEIHFNDKLIMHQYQLSTVLCTAEGFDVSNYDTLILDVQGAELLVLQGAESILNNFRFIRLETWDFEAYEGCALDHQIEHYLLRKGFVKSQGWMMSESQPGMGIYEVLYESTTTKKNCKIVDPETGIETKVKVGVVTSVPRLGFQVHMSVMHDAFGSKGWPIAKVGGAFWEQSIQNGMNKLVKLGCDYIITVDYDSIFSNDDVLELLNMAAKYPEADAIASWQIRRHGELSALNGRLDENGEFRPFIPKEEFTEEVTKIDHTVFGLTLIKTEALSRMNKPWFQSMPNKDGEWETGKTDADGYFWKKWRETGNTIYVANRVKIGHLEEIVLWMDNNFNPIRQPLQDFYREGRPF